MKTSHFYFHPGALDYNFGPQHPLKPERLRRTLELLERFGVKPEPAELGTREDLTRVHDSAFVDFVASIAPESDWNALRRFGFSQGDTPPFPGIWDASRAYVGATAAAARAVNDGALLAFGIAGGLHHARRAEASGFCVFNDAAVAAHILLERFERVAYIDIDLHHGDGVQWIFYDEPRVLTCSIHEDGRTLYPGTGFVEEIGGPGAEYTSLNVPLLPGTGGAVWLDAFNDGVMLGVEKFQPGAIVLQMGTDAHFLDPLGHLDCSAQHWLDAVKLVRDFGSPVVAVGGGGYNLNTVPRMWAAAVLALSRVEFEDALPPDLAARWGVPTFFDAEVPESNYPATVHAEAVVEWLRTHHHPRIPMP